MVGLRWSPWIPFILFMEQGILPSPVRHLTTGLVAFNHRKINVSIRSIVCIFRYFADYHAQYVYCGLRYL